MERKRDNRGTGRRLLIILLILVMAVSGTMTVRQWLQDKKVQEQYESLAEEVQDTTQAPAETQETEPEEEPYVSPIDFDKLKEENPDTIGWIRVPGTNIDYPIVQGEDNDFYLNHDFNGNESVAGSIYLDFESQGDFIGRNNVLYGHNMKNGSMFKDVVRYKDEEYFKEHQYFSIYTPDREIRLKAVSCYYGPAEPIVRKTKFVSQESFDSFVQEMISPCSYAETVSTPAKSLYTLVTCSYEINDARTFLFAVEVDEDGNEIAPDEEFLEVIDKIMEPYLEQVRQAQQNQQK